MKYIIYHEVMVIGRHDGGTVTSYYTISVKSNTELLHSTTLKENKNDAINAFTKNQKLVINSTEAITISTTPTLGE